jgi:hypothetical protein
MIQARQWYCLLTESAYHYIAKGISVPVTPPYPSASKHLKINDKARSGST